MKLIVGLGNPGEKYARNRHNIGFMALERSANRYGRGAWRKKFSSSICDADVDGTKALLLCPQTYYNEAGRAVAEAARFHKIEPEDIIVFHDEIDLAPGKVRVKLGGGHAGNNGLRSISAHVGADFWRVRIGVGHPGNKDAVASYVLHDFPKADGDGLDIMLDAMATYLPELTEGAADKFQTGVAQALANFRDDKPSGPRKKSSASATSVGNKPKPAARHPAGERQSKQKTALADNLKRWLAGRAGKDK